jgi:hypothetical protein
MTRLWWVCAAVVRKRSFVVGLCSGDEETHKRVIKTHLWCAVDGGGAGNAQTSRYDSFVVGVCGGGEETGVCGRGVGGKWVCAVCAAMALRVGCRQCW